MRRKKLFFLILILIIIPVAFIIFCGYYLIFTTKGAGVISKFLLAKYVEGDKIGFKEIEGSLAEKLVYHNVEVKNLKGLPPEAVLKIQELKIYFTTLNFSGLNLEIQNGRLMMPDSDAILFYGNYQRSAFDVKVYCKEINLRDTLDLFVEAGSLKDLSGDIYDLDIVIKGDFLDPDITGNFQLKSLSYGGFTMRGCTIAFSLQLKDVKNNLKLYGEILMETGELTGPRTAVVKLEKSKIIFNGDYAKPTFDLKGKSIIEGTKIKITLKGTIESPELRLTSTPPVPEGWLLVMLATGRSWRSSGSALKQGNITPDLAKDFIDYFVFAGSGSKIIQKFGLSDISITYNEEKKGIGVKKDITDKAEVTYSIEQPREFSKESVTTHKIGGEYNITEHISVGAEKEIKQPTEKSDAVPDKLKTDDRVYLKYKKEF
ncbi:MAG: translocation/assembly module TamB domain-containing protein [Candidatus Omnitrophota bacterium]